MVSECRGGKARVSFFLTFLVLAMSALPAFAAHTSVAGLEPKYSAADTQINYDVNFTNLGGDRIDEVRIYRNLTYSNFSCSPKAGWDLYFITSKQACQYVVTDSSYSINSDETASFGFSAKTPAPGECNLKWRFETRDVNEQWQYLFNTTSVDNNTPIITKVVGDPKVQVDATTYYINKSTPITLNASDPPEDNGCKASGIKYCRYRYYVVETDTQSSWTDWTANASNGYTFTFPEDSTHLLEVECADNAGNVANLTETDYVDTVAPHTDKTYGRPFVTDGTYDWITSQTPVTFSAVDLIPHPAGVKEIHWRNTWLPQVPDELCVAKCDGEIFQGDGTWNVTPGDHATIYKPEQSCHLIEFFAVDNLGNEEPRNKQCVFVDNTPPEGSKIIGEPKIIKTTGSCVNVSNGGPAPQNVSVGRSVANITFPEGAATGVGVAFDGEFLYYSYTNSKNLYKIRPDGTGHQVIATTGIQETGLGALSYDATRGKIWAGTFGCRNGEGPVYLIDPATGVATYLFSVSASYINYCLDDGIAYDATDDSIWYSDDVAPTMVHMSSGGTFLGTVDVCAIDSRLCSNSGIAIGGDNFYLGTNGKEVTLRVHRNFTLLDEFVNTNFRIEDMECDPDTYSPTEVMWIRDAYGGNAQAYEIEPGTCGLGGQPPVCVNTTDIYVTTDTNLTLSCRDPIPHPVKQETVFWQFSNHDGENWSYSNWYSSTQLPVKVHFNEDSYHDLTYYCKDGLNNTGAQDKEYFYVETVPPVINKTVVGPQYAEVGTCPPQSLNDKCFILANATTIHVEAKDPPPHPVDDVRCDWSYTLNGTLMGGAREVTPPFDVTFPEDSTHVLTIKCEDSLHNTVVDIETFKVDAKPPVTTKTYGEPFYYDQQTGREFMTSETEVTLTAEDEKVGVDKIYYLNTLVTGESQRMCENPQRYCQPIHGYDADDWTVYLKPFTKTPESCHVIEYWSVDKLGNKEPIRAQCVYVDNSYPILNKTVGTPKFPCEAPGGGINASCSASRTYTLNADFDEGTLIGLEHDTVADQLQIDQGQVSTFPLLWVANAGEDSLSKWDTNTNKELARYHTWFPIPTHGAWSGPAPSRTAVDSDGNAYVANRHFDGKPANVFKILADNWIDRNGNGVMDTSYDANSNGVIEASEMLPMYDNNSNGIIDDSEITDERIAWVATVGSAGAVGRSLAIDLDGNIWLGLYYTQQYYKLSGVNGSVLGGPYAVGNNPYGSLVDKHGILWGASLGSTLLRLDTNNPTNTTTYYHGTYGSNYGIALGYDGAGNTQVYLGSQSSHTYIQFNSATNTFSTPAQYQYYTLGISTDSQGNILAGSASDGSLSKFAPNGTRIWYSSSQYGEGARGTAVDSSDNIWVIHEANSKLSKFGGVNGSHLGVFNSGLYPYTYSDATGLGFSGSVSSGIWTVVFDSEADNTTFGAVTWNGNEPNGTSIKVEIRSSNDQASWSPWETVSNGVPPVTTPLGRYLEVKATLKITSGETSPILYDLSVKAASCGEAKADCWWVRDHVTPITLSCTDQDPHPVGYEQACYKLSYDLDQDGYVTDQYCDEYGGEMEGDWCCEDVSNSPYTFDFTEDSWHNLTFFCRDRLGNTNPAEDFEYFRVDSTPPTTTKTYGGPRYINETTGAEYLDSASYIELSAVDGGEHCAIGDVKTYWQNVLVGDSYCQSPQNCEAWSPDNLDSEEWNLYNGPIFQTQESCHAFAFYSEDKLGNNESVQWQCFFVDKKTPVTTKHFEGSQYPADGDAEGVTHWISPATGIVLNASDPDPHPSGVNYTLSRYALVDDAYCRDQQLCNGYEGTIDKAYDKSSPNLLFNIGEESCHLIEYYSVDNVNKTELKKRQCVFVDDTAPTTAISVSGPQFYDEDTEKTYLDGVTRINLTCTDTGQHPSGVDAIWYRYNVDGGEWTPLETYDGPFGFQEESMHTLEYYCVDNVQNVEQPHSVVYYVDHTPPVTTKSYEGYLVTTPSGYEVINTSTLVHLDADDGNAVHSSGVNVTKYRVTVVDNGYCAPPQGGIILSACENEVGQECVPRNPCSNAVGNGSWVEYGGPFANPEQSCHLIEYYSVDNVNKTEQQKRQCVVVDNTPPAPVKTVGEPKSTCTEAEGCDWKVTTLTPIKLNCSDDHTIGAKTVWYRYFLDGFLGQNWTQVSAPYTLYFEEESNHTLDFYCEDALKLPGAVDSENIKVEGTAFELSLYKKWNLISVPFVLLNDSVDDVFKDVKENVSSVWTYDNGNWSVWTPDGNGPQTLQEVKPGFGYWVLTKADGKLLLGGALFSPIKTPPDRQLGTGWNLIGYYGTDWQNYGEDVVECSYDAGPKYWDYARCSLGTLVNPQNGYPRWDSLWTYVNCAGADPWKGINACTDNPDYKMVAGYGYWLHLDVSDMYAPSSVCIARTDCVQMSNELTE